MPSLHFATSLMAAHLLAEAGRGHGRRGVDVRGHARASRSCYLGEHYVVDLLAGAALAEGVRRGGAAGRAGGSPADARRSRRLERRAHA